MASEDISSFARLDFGRKARTGFGETVFGGGKTPEQLAKIFAAFKAARQPALATRCTAEQAAHLIHGSSDGRFSITYCVKNITKEEVEGVGFKAADYDEMAAKYDPAKLAYGYNTVDGEEIYFIPNPALGLWINRERFN